MKNMDSNFVLKFFLFKCICVVIIGILYLPNDRKNQVSSIKSSEINQRKLYDLQKCDRGGKKDSKLKNKSEGTTEQQNNKNNGNNLKNEELLSRTNKKCLKVDLNREKLLKYFSFDKENIKDKVINYNDLTNNLNRKELLAVLETINDKTPRNDLINIWSHVVGINRGEIDELIDKLIAYTEYYMNKHNKHDININDMKTFLNINPKGWNDFKVECVKKIACEDSVFSQRFYKILKKEKKIEEIKKLIKSYIEYADDIKNKEYENYIERFHYLFEKYINSLGKKKKNTK
ncbi:Plasmodium exported protein (PHISTa), unknown function [Plasmodium reichenowi]|uniref:Plasmodium RESA N-terminal domain-containing protein n=1 Tax=Plasmodium reichenowi TaxID=5854 RepID=A0A060RM81_PLARE|nr:Plasmodium exported protein (PHISTa), unknown function [Plasmodium reichenowi]